MYFILISKATVGGASTLYFITPFTVFENTLFTLFQDVANKTLTCPINKSS